MRPKCIAPPTPGVVYSPQLYMGVGRATPRAIRDVHKAMGIRRLEAEVCALPTLRGWGSMDATWVVERLHPSPRECCSIAMGQGQQRYPSLSSGNSHL